MIIVNIVIGLCLSLAATGIGTAASLEQRVTTLEQRQQQQQEAIELLQLQTKREALRRQGPVRSNGVTPSGDRVLLPAFPWAVPQGGISYP